MKIKSKWVRKWHDETEIDDLRIFLEAWHDTHMDVGLIIVSYNKGKEAEKKVLETFAYVGDYRQTIRRAMGIWSKDIHRFVKTLREETGEDGKASEAEES
jgi:hypothetical protein